MASALLVISNREPLVWMLRTQSFALPARRASSAPHLDDRLLLYTTRGCYRNPTRDRGMVMGLAHVTAEPGVLAEPVRFGDREFAIGLGLAIDGVCPVHQGVDLAAQRGELALLAGDGPWSYRLRRSVVPLSESDATKLRSRLAPLLRPVADVLPGFLNSAHLAEDEEST